MMQSQIATLLTVLQQNSTNITARPAQSITESTYDRGNSSVAMGEVSRVEIVSTSVKSNVIQGKYVNLASLLIPIMYGGEIRSRQMGVAFI